MVLGFKPVAVVRKTRRHGFTAWNNCQVEVAFDEVDGLGPFLELEICADDSAVSMAKDALLGLAEKLALGKGERRSYLSCSIRRSPNFGTRRAVNTPPSDRPAVTANSIRAQPGVFFFFILFGRPFRAPAGFWPRLGSR
jgi:hypothetical protein